MPFIIKLWKMNFFKNNTEEGGAMKSAIESLKPNQLVIHSQTQKNGRLWGCTEPLHLLSLLEKNHGIYEVITAFPHKVYFDIDDTGEPDPSKLSKIKDIISSIFVGAEFAVSGSVTPTKTSYHITLTNYIIRNEDERQTIKLIVKKWQQDLECFDWKVYTKNRNMKAINQSKDDGRIQEIIENPDFRMHLITCFFPEFPLPFPEPEEDVKLEVAIERSKSTFDLSLLPKMIISLPDNFDIEQATPLEILKIFPLNKTFDHTYTHTVARFCFGNSISFDDFLSWLQNKHPSISAVKTRWQSHWRNISRFPPVKMSKVRTILKYFYPTILKPKHMLRFQNAFILPQDHIVHIDRISQDQFAYPQKALIFNIGMGAGKTAQTNTYLSEIVKRGETFIWVTPNIALANNTLQRISENGVICADYRKFKTHEKRGGKLAEQPNLMICANSLHYLAKRQYDTIIIDEPETFFDKWYGSFMDKVAGTKRRNWEVLINIFKTAKRIIFLDAFTSKKSIDFVKNFVKDDYVIFERPTTEITRTIEYIPDKQITLDMLTTDINRGLKTFIFYPYKKDSQYNQGMKTIFDSISEQTGKKGVFYNADQDDDIKAGLSDVNASWKSMDFVITNSMITCGVNYDQGDFDICYIFVARFSQARDILQVSARSRDFSTKTIRICFMEKMIPPDVWENDTEKMNCTIYTQTYNNIMIEKKAPTRESIHLLSAKAGYKQATLKKSLLRELELEHLKLIENAECFSSYETIPIIDQLQAEHIENCMFAQCATMEQKFSIQKFYFNCGFLPSASEERISEAWNQQLGQFFDVVKEILWEKEHSIFHKIAVANSYTSIFPPESLFSRKTRSKIQIPPDVMERIFKMFEFRYLKQDSSKAMILEKVINKTFSKNIISTNCSDSKNTEYEIDEDWNRWVEFLKEHALGIDRRASSGVCTVFSQDF